MQATDSWASTPTVRKTMVANRARNTGPEMAVRRLVHRRGLRYRVNARPLPHVRRTADLVFRRERVAVFIDGCFWHACPIHGTSPKAHAEWWREKLRRNVERDRETDELLASAGWTVIRVWEHEVPEVATTTIETAVVRARETGSTSPRV